MNTPMRPVPGAYFNTPAPRRLNFGDTTGVSAMSGPVAPTGTGSSILGGGHLAPVGGPANGAVTNGPAKEEPSPVAKAAASINATLQLDESYPDIDSYCRPGASSEYELQSPDSPWAPFQKTNMYPIPDEIFNRLNTGHFNTSLGLFADIGYAWAVIDSSIFLWDYSNPNPQLIGYEDATQPITAVALVPPKKDVFVNTITHILVVATTYEIILLGVSATPTPSGAKSVSLYQTKMSVHRGGSDVSFIRGTASGRIFFGGTSDTDVYELFYQQEERWFSSRCGKINHTSPGWSAVVPTLSFGGREQEHLTGIYVDDTRNLVYTLSNKSTIRTYHMETPEKLTKVIEKDKDSCLRDAVHMTGASKLLTNQMTIVSLSPISATEASKLHLMATTDTGCRLFLSATSSASYMIGATTSLAPQSMQVQFVKFPPKDQSLGRVALGAVMDGLDKESLALSGSTSGTRFAPGYFFDFVTNSANPTESRLFVSAPDTGRIKITSPASALKYYEQGNWIELTTGNKALAVGLTTSPFAAARQPLGFGNELAVQFDHSAGEFAVLTTTGVHLIRRRRLVDIFAAAIRGASGDEGLERELRKFIAQYGRVETISAALAVACGQGSDLRTGTSRATDQTTEDRARAAFVDFGGQPRFAETDGGVFTADAVRLSSRHDALALYLARLIRQLWKSKVVSIKVEKSSFNVSSTISIQKLVGVQENVERLRNFLEANKGIIQGLTGPSERVTTRHEEIALQMEHQALHSLRKLMESVSEGISFVLMLFDERVSDIYVRLDEDARIKLKDLTYESLFAEKPGKELAKVLVKAIVNRNIASGANVETVADALRRRCGSFCSPDDVVIFKAQEQLQRASEQVNNPSALRTLLGESLRLFEQVAGSLTSANLRSAVEQYVGLKYYAGAIQLCLVVARERDRGNTALPWVNEGKPIDDTRKKAFDRRQECYSLIHEVLDELEKATAHEPETMDGRLTLAATKRLEAYNVVNGSDDEVFHFDLYDWYIQKEWTDRILAIDSPHVITYLKRLADTDAKHADLLCRFYTHRSRFFEAATVQADLAKSEFPIGIKDRITLLSRAKGNASVNTIGISRQQQQELNHEVTELLEIAHIQDDILERLRADPRIHDTKLVEIEAALDGPIQSLTELYNNYADQANYYDLCLLIYHAADYQNPRTINETWENLIVETHNDNEERQEIWRLYQAGQPLPAGIEAPTAEPPLPYESVSTAIQNIAHRTSVDSFIFPVDGLLPLVCGYSINQEQNAAIGADPCWPVLLFLHLGVPHALITHVLEDMFEAQESPFNGRRRRFVVQWITVAIEAWVRDAERRGIKGGESAIGTGIADLLARCEECITELASSTRNATENEELMETRKAIKVLRRAVDTIIGAEQAGLSLFGR